MALAIDIPVVEPPPWLGETTCSACGGRRCDMDPPWEDRDIRALSVYLSEDPSCRSAGIAQALRERMLDHSWVEAHRGCAVSCECGVVVPLLEGHKGLVRATDRAHSGTIRCLSCRRAVPVVGVRARLFVPPIPRVEGVTWCGSGQSCAADRCPLRGST